MLNRVLGSAGSRRCNMQRGSAGVAGCLPSAKTRLQPTSAELAICHNMFVEMTTVCAGAVVGSYRDTCRASRVSRRVVAAELSLSFPGPSRLVAAVPWEFFALIKETKAEYSRFRGPAVPAVETTYLPTHRCFSCCRSTPCDRTASRYS